MRITLNTLRRMEANEEAMIRSLMPKTAAACPEPIESAVRPSLPRTGKVWSLPALRVSIAERAR